LGPPELPLDEPDTVDGFVNNYEADVERGETELSSPEYVVAALTSRI
jgi:hypothetical protein